MTNGRDFFRSLFIRNHFYYRIFPNPLKVTIKASGYREFPVKKMYIDFMSTNERKF